jgi:hypothetical protein
MESLGIRYASIRNDLRITANRQAAAQRMTISRTRHVTECRGASC